MRSMRPLTANAASDVGGPTAADTTRAHPCMQAGAGAIVRECDVQTCRHLRPANGNGMEEDVGICRLLGGGGAVLETGLRVRQPLKSELFGSGNLTHTIIIISREARLIVDCVQA